MFIILKKKRLSAVIIWMLDLFTKYLNNKKFDYLKNNNMTFEKEEFKSGCHIFIGPPRSIWLLP